MYVIIASIIVRDTITIHIVRTIYRVSISFRLQFPFGRELDSIRVEILRARAFLVMFDIRNLTAQVLLSRLFRTFLLRPVFHFFVILKKEHV